jgi:hypothetical protein
MQGHRIMLPIHVPGTLSANLSIVLQMPFAARILEVSASQSNNGDATLAVGAGSDGSTATIAAFAVGDSSVPVVKTVADFATTNPQGKLANNDYLKLTVDYDGAGGTAANDLSILITLIEGGP